MPDFSVVATVISTTGALLGALGGVALTHRANIRREEAQFNRQRKDQRMQARREAYGELLDTATQLKAEIEVAGQRHWKGMNVRIATIQRHAASVVLHASTEFDECIKLFSYGGSGQRRVNRAVVTGAFAAGSAGPADYLRSWFRSLSAASR